MGKAFDEILRKSLLARVGGQSVAVEKVTVQKRILIVDAYLHSLEGLRWSLMHGEWKVETATDTWQAIKKVKESPFEVAIIDLGLPPVHGLTMSGWDLVRIFRAFHPGISIIVVSADGGPEVKAQAELLKVSEFLEKPIDLARLKAVVSRLDP
ncbi:MAG: response regulator [Candidatus Tectomicrobia bacterium]|uniref:Response regulator n=1 Tax=Tectimicrobiota bacterium TaxID=2528274 RepID=A0A932M212_UNCTE|nr:response regulator [Candidatus Tectomicrobia bacterium]